LRRLLFATLAGSTILLAVFSAAGIWFRSEIQTPFYGAPSSEVFITIRRGAGTREIANILTTQGILHTQLPLMLYLRFTKYDRRIQAGEYRFNQAATPKQIAQRLVRGDVYFHSITIPEGLTAHETIELLTEKGFGNRLAMEHALQRTDWIRDLDPSAQNLEGYLFPETYRFDHKADSEAMVRKMVEQFRNKFSEVLKASPLPIGWNPSRIVTLASLIEKEVKHAGEGPLVASVLVNRLNKKMPLGCDATIIYAMKLAGIYEGHLGKADLKMESPYNSYLHRNLPPGPICNPGVVSLRAALNPARTNYYYYVSRNDGTHQFSKDYRSHSLAVYKYQQSPARKRNQN
jgi:UPF0755 protein